VNRDSALVALANTEHKMKILGEVETSCVHSESRISDLDKYSKAEVDSLFAGVVKDGSVPAHTHTEANISDLDKYSKAEADQKIEDGKTTMLVGHLAESNPHNITKADVGLGNVDNLSKVSLFSDPAFSGALNGAISGISKASISLGNVPNVDVQALLQAHLNDEDNTHKVALSDFDTYSRAQTDSQIQTLIEIYRTVHTGTLPADWAILVLRLLVTWRNRSHIGIELWKPTGHIIDI